MRSLVVAIVLTVCCTLLGCSQTPGAPKFPVTGSVSVNGEPAVGMIIRFHARGQGLAGQDAQPAAVADAEGRFKLSSFGNQDGAAAADYKVTFYWPTNPILASEDRLKGAYASVEKSPFSVTVTEETTELEPFTLEVEPKELLPGVDLESITPQPNN
ncbi:MAG: hypothetical protein AAFX06_17765 [Planctomycetota bacterium]